LSGSRAALRAIDAVAAVGPHIRVVRRRRRCIHSAAAPCHADQWPDSWSRCRARGFLAEVLPSGWVRRCSAARRARDCWIPWRRYKPGQSWRRS